VTIGFRDFFWFLWTDFQIFILDVQIAWKDLRIRRLKRILGLAVDIIEKA
jgi:hypothetical protein